MFQKDLRFIRSRSTSEVGIDVFFWKSHEFLLLSEEVLEAGIHRYVPIHRGGGGGVAYVQRSREERRVGFDENGSHQGPWLEHVTLFALVGKTYCPAGLGKFNIDGYWPRRLTQRGRRGELD